MCHEVQGDMCINVQKLYFVQYFGNASNVTILSDLFKVLIITTMLGNVLIITVIDL